MLIWNYLYNSSQLHPSRNTSLPRGHQYNANSRVASKERIAALQQKRAATPNNKRRSVVSANAVTHALNQQQMQKNKPAFSIAKSDDTDEDEWVSSESGAATPQRVNGAEDDDDGSESQDTEVEADVHTSMTDQKARTGAVMGQAMPNTLNGSIYVGNGDIMSQKVTDKISTPRADLDTTATQGRSVFKQTSSSTSTSTLHAQVPPEMPVVRVQPQSTPITPPEPPAPESEPLRQSKSEAPSPTRRSMHSRQFKRHSLMRNSSHGEPSKYEIPPHPLIRGQSYSGSGALKLKPAPLTPLTVDSAITQAQISASPTSTRIASGPSSPTFMTRSLTLQSPTTVSFSGEPERDYRQPSRRTSISSLHSVATLPAPSPVHAQAYSRLGSQGGVRSRQGDRARTLSMMSTGSSSAALTSLNMNMMSRPGTPPSTVRFPKESISDGDGIHPLLPPPYCATHLTMASHYNPLYDCYERVLRAKQSR